MKPGVVLLALLVASAGCASKEGPGAEEPSFAPAPTTMPPRQILDKEGNNAQCTNVLSGTQTFPFTVEEGYDRIEVTFHASGLGQVGYSVRRADGGELLGQADTNPANQPCSHAHEGGARLVDVGPGTYTVEVRNTGILGWHLLVNERASGSNGSTDHQHGTT